MRFLPMHTLTSLLLTAFLIMSAVLSAQTLDLPPGKWWEIPRLVEHIQLTKEQQEHIGDLVYQSAQRMIDLNAGVQRTKLTLEKEVDRTNFDPDAVRAAFATFQKARHQLENERFEMLLSVRQVLTPEQWGRLAGLRDRLDQSRQRRKRPGEFPGAPDRRPTGAGPG